MSPRSPEPFPYSSFDAISVSSTVHLRVLNADASVKPEFANAVLQGDAVADGPHGEYSATFYVPDLGHNVKVSEVQYRAWTRHRQV